MDRGRWTPRRVLTTASGAGLVATFPAFLALRNQDGLESLIGTGSVFGWAGHGASILILLSGAALLARGVFGADPAAESTDGATDERPSHEG